MKTTSFAAIGCLLIGLAGCTAGSKFIDPRTELDKKIYYIERDQAGDNISISNTSIVKENIRTVTRVPMPGVVDINSTIQIAIAKESLGNDKVRSALSKESDDLIQRKKAVTGSLNALSEVVLARTRTLQMYGENRDINEFLKARDESDRIESQFRAELIKLWPSSNAESYAALTQSYFADRRSFQKLQEFLSNEVATIETAHRQLELSLKSRQATLALEAFLTSPGKQPTAIHLDGYDTIKAESLVRRDPLGLDLSPEEKSRLDAQVKSTREMADALERLRRGEQTLNETLRRLALQMAPEIGTLVSRADVLAAKFTPEELARRRDETKKLFTAFLAAIDAQNKKFLDTKKTDLQSQMDNLIVGLPAEVGEFQKALQEWIANGKQLKSDWGKAPAAALTPEAMLVLINQTVDVAKKFDALRKKLPESAQNVETRMSSILGKMLTDMAAEEKNLVLQSPQAQELKSNLESYAFDLRQASSLVTDVYVTLSRLAQPVTEIPPSTSTSLDIPLDKIKDTFIDLEQTPRFVGDLITIKATSKSGDQIDTSLATFRVERFGHYAELSPAVVLAKPQHIAGTDTGFRFAPALSWMYHWAPRPESSITGARLARTLEPSIGIHSAFLNFNSPTSSTSAQIGLGATFALWKNRLQFGYGINLMAKSRDEGRSYYFVGSDLIGLLQTVGIGK